MDVSYEKLLSQAICVRLQVTVLAELRRYGTAWQRSSWFTREIYMALDASERAGVDRIALARAIARAYETYLREYRVSSSP